MKAFEARKATVQPQFEAAMKEIEQAIGWGWKSCHVSHSCSLYPEVADMIAKEGFDVKIVLRADDMMSYNLVSWEHAEEGKEGTVTYVDETKPKPQPKVPSFGEFLSDILGMNPEEIQKNDSEDGEDEGESEDTESVEKTAE